MLRKKKSPLNTLKTEMVPKTFKTYATIHGPIYKRDGKWISPKSNNRSMGGLVQSCLYQIKRWVIKKKLWTVVPHSQYGLADSKHGHIELSSSKRSQVRFLWSKVMDGNNIYYRMERLHEVSESVHLTIPQNGWLQNWIHPFSVSGNET
jgi:hypothetical protein